MRYAMLYKARIVIALLLLCGAVGTQLAGPYIAKVIIDGHLLSISKSWYETAPSAVPEGTAFVDIRGKAYVREDWTNGTEPGADWRRVAIRQEGTSFVLEDGSVPGGTRLTNDEVLALYSREFAPIVRLLVLYVGLLALSGLLTFAQSYMLQTTALTIIRQMRTDVMTHIHRISVRYFDNTPVGQVVSRIANDTEAIRDLFMSFMATFVVSGVNLIGIYVAIFLLDVRLALFCLLLIPFFVVVMAIHLKYSKGYVTVMRARLSDMNAMLNESINVMPMIQAFRREKDRVAEFETLNEDRYANQLKQMRLFSLSSRNIVGLTGSLLTAGVIWYFGGRSLETAISFGVFYAFIDYLGRIFQPIIGIFDQLTNAQRAIVSAERVFSLLDREGAPVEDESAPDRPRPQGNVKFDGVWFAYNGDDYVLRNISLEARRGETIALVGHTGSGKSSIMNLLLGFYEPTRGTITIDGEDVTAMPKQALRRHMGIVLQDPFLFTGDIKFNVGLYEERIDPETIRKALRDVGASGFVEKLPHGYDEPVVERGNTLSAGQRQLISFARALAFDPAILILDEATASIDSETEGLIQNALRVLCAGRTTFVIAHRLSTIKDADRILVLHRGEIVESGSHDELMARQGRYFNMYRLQKGEPAPVAPASASDSTPGAAANAT
ncbi:multidrug ABC transporter permease [Paenibacillus flagellatus]|uniref:Multidrug ABC transporter permease n=2 Tax=Paenibacillus flagellatus TaxID=2211139 RepID=A0A2V5K302_9BACL|nr:multidrug ABC transporter permease [Paenibacillus flagellatus]